MKQLILVVAIGSALTYGFIKYDKYQDERKRVAFHQYMQKERDKVRKDTLEQVKVSENEVKVKNYSDISDSDKWLKIDIPTPSGINFYLEKRRGLVKGEIVAAMLSVDPKDINDLGNIGLASVKEKDCANWSSGNGAIHIKEVAIKDGKKSVNYVGSYKFDIVNKPIKDRTAIDLIGLELCLDTITKQVQDASKK